MCSLCTPQCVLQPPFFQHLVVSPPISGFWAAGAFGSSSCVWCSHVFGHRVSGSLCAFIFFRKALGTCFAEKLVRQFGLPICWDFFAHFLGAVMEQPEIVW